MTMNLNKKINNLFLEFSLFSIYGLISNAISFIFYFIIINFLDQKYITAYFFSTSSILIINFYVYLKIFKTIYNSAKLLKYLITQIIFFITHLLIIMILVEYFFINEIFSHLFSNIFLASIIFFVYKFFIFNKKKN